MTRSATTPPSTRADLRYGTLDEYFDADRAGDVRLEHYGDGRIVARAGETSAHSPITVNVCVEVR